MAKQRRAGLPDRLSGRAAPQTAEAGHDIWNGTISFSLVAIPVRLVNAVAPGRVSFRMLHRKDYAPLESRMFCPRDGKIVPREEIVRGYEISPGRFIPITGRELDSVSPERSRTIEVTHFVDTGEVDPIYYDSQYYLIPLKGGEKPYRLLVEVLRRTAKAGVASLVLAEREYPVLVRSAGGLLAVNTLHYPDEITPVKGVDAGTRGRAEPEMPGHGDAEKERMKQAIRKKVSKFNPEKYADQRRRKIIALLEKKMKGKSLVQAPETEKAKREAPLDLVAALKASMRRTDKQG
jgi:DNA end-binding protein Ku